MTEEQIFLAALELPSKEYRSAYLDSACGADAELRRQVDELLAAHFRSGEFLNESVGQQLGTTPIAHVDETIVVARRSDEAAMAGPADQDPAADDTSGLDFLQPSSRPDSLGQIGHYEILQVLGKGGFGIVFRAFDNVLQRIVALKVLAPTIAATSPARKRFLREAQASARVRHENVVQVYAVEELPTPYIVMEFIAGETLQQRLDRTGPLEVAEVVGLARQVAEGLAAAHETGLIHRDIKPGNVLIEGGAHERVKITDFGLARAADDASMTQSGTVAGTPLFMAPEQARGVTLDQRADLFSLGSVIYTMASGRPPFRAATTFAVLKRVVEETPRPLKDIIPETPQWLCDIISRLHEKLPNNRFQSAREVADVLTDCEDQLKQSSRVHDLSKIPRPAPVSSGFWKWGAVAAILLPMLALAATESAGITQLFGTQEAAPNVTPMTESESKEIPAGNSHVAVPPLAIAPFDATQAKAHQVAWAKHLGVPVEFTNSIGMKFMLIPPGEFAMGTSAADAEKIIEAVPEWAKVWVLSETPARKVRILKPFYMGTTEVTVGQFKQFVAATEYKTLAETNGRGGDSFVEGIGITTRPEFTWRHPDLTRSDSHPVGQLCCEDANAFCSWLQKLDGRTYQLPDEEQWEYACRAGTVTPWSFGTSDELAQLHGITEWNQSFTGRAVAQRPANPFGMFDVHGNFDEMCRSQHGIYFNRGGSSACGSLLTRSASRGSPIDPLRSYFQQSFRVAIVGNLRP